MWTHRIRQMISPCLLLAATAGKSFAQPDTVAAPRQCLDDAWWTGPIVTNSAGVLPRGHALIESYLLDAITDHAKSYESLTYMLYGVTDRFTIGPIPVVGVSSMRGGRASSGPHLGDTGILAKFALTRFDAASGMPDLSLAVQENLPTGKYDRLGDRPSNGFGNGAYTTVASLFSQMYFWLPNGRLFRTRLDLSAGFSSTVDVQDVSVYGTGAGFLGHAQPGNSFSADTSFEYSLTRSWVLALDVIYNHGNATITRGFQAGQSVEMNSGSSDGIGFAPAVEFSWTPDLGLLVGARVFTKGHNTPASVTPAVAINWVT
jgi:hypothetical protein